jgi:hypothetical protein
MNNSSFTTSYIKNHLKNILSDNFDKILCLNTDDNIDLNSYIILDSIDESNNLIDLEFRQNDNTFSLLINKNTIKYE